MKKPKVKLPVHSSTERIIHLILLFLRVSIGLIILWAFLNGDWESFFISILALVLTFIPEMIETKYKMELPIEFDIAIVGFIYLSVFVGETFDAYERFFWWDAMLHTASGVVLGFCGFLILYILQRQGKLQASPMIIAVFTFCFGVALGGVWEIFEFTIDSVFGTNMQKDGLSDTMWDLIVDTVGALAISVAAYFVVKDGETKGLLRKALDRFFAENPRFEIGE